jgi:hypothetical protein
LWKNELRKHAVKDHANNKLKPAQKWFQIRYDLYQHVRARVQQRMGRDPLTLRKYGKALAHDYSKRWTASTVKELFQRTLDADLVFLADFHALQQSQKTHLRILRRISASGRKNILVVECIEAKYQKHIRQFLQGDLSEDEFLRRVHWKESWGFPWENYRPIFQWARDKKVPIYGVNVKEKKLTEIARRDRFASEKIRGIQARHPGARVFVIYGDLHMASAHLPKLLKKPGQKHLCVLQNSERIYFQALKKNGQDTLQIVRLDANTYCVLNVPPWVKWQNYLMFLEQTYDENLDESVDYTDHIMFYVKVLSKELGLKVALSDLSVYTAKDSIFWEKIQTTCTAHELDWVARFIDEEAVFYLAGTRAGYLPRASVNHAAALAMEYLLFKLSGLNKNMLAAPEDFTRWIWMNGWSYFGSKLINPRRKTDTLHDIKARLTNPQGKLEREPLQLALSQKIFELARASGHATANSKMKPRRKNSYIIAAELLGGLMGEKIFEAYSRNKLSVERIRKQLALSMDSPAFQSEYFKFIQFLEEIPISFKSKEEKI